MPHSNRALDAQRYGNGDDVAAEIAPRIWRVGFCASAVPAKFDRDPAPLREIARDFIPGAAVKPSGVREQNGRVRALPLPGRNLDSSRVGEA